ncbi:MAG: NAD/NADP octopine/nopaline dehydrogenase family protein [Desulfobacterales bacterium]|nr:NAD/NADP octopine/nopaline dehydrogenase family protein [Desulfobacterales bacterium]
MNNNIKQITVFGAGNAGISEATRIKLHFPEIRVILYNRISNEKSRKKLALLQCHKMIHLSGIYQGEAIPDVITSHVDEAVNESQMIVITTTANAHGFIASQMAPYLSDGQIILIFAGGIDSKLLMAKKIKKEGCTADLTFADADTFIYATKIKKLSPSKVEMWVKAKKEKLYLSVLPSERMPHVLDLLEKNIYPDQFIGCHDPLQAGINDGPGLHIIGIIMQRKKIEAQEDFNFYLGLTEEMTEMIEELDRERIAVARAMGIRDCPTTRDFLYTAYNIPLTEAGRKRSLFDMVHDKGTPYYNPPEGPIRSPAPKKMNHRYLYEEVMTRVVPLYYMAKALEIDTPLHKRLIEEAGKILNRDYFKEGRNLDDLGLSPRDIQDWQATKKRFERSF